MNNYDYFCYVGTYTSGGVITPEKKSEGIYVLGYDSSKGELEKLSSGYDKDNPSFLTISPNGQFLYSVGEIDDSRGGALSSYSIPINILLSYPIWFAAMPAHGVILYVLLKQQKMNPSLGKFKSLRDNVTSEISLLAILTW